MTRVAPIWCDCYRSNTKLAQNSMVWIARNERSVRKAFRSGFLRQSVNGSRA